MIMNQSEFLLKETTQKQSTLCTHYNIYHFQVTCTKYANPKRDTYSSSIQNGIQNIIQYLSTTQNNIDLQNLSTVQDNNDKGLDVKAFNSDKDLSIQLHKEDTKYNVADNVVDGGRKSLSLRHESLAQNKHKSEMKEIHEYMLISREITNYFYEEAVRMTTYQTIIDGMRKMLKYLENPRHTYVKKVVFQCFLKMRVNIVTTKNPWRHDTNDLIIDDTYDRFEGFQMGQIIENL